MKLIDLYLKERLDEKNVSDVDDARGPIFCICEPYQSLMVWVLDLMVFCFLLCVLT